MLARKQLFVPAVCARQVLAGHKHSAHDTPCVYTSAQRVWEPATWGMPASFSASLLSFLQCPIVAATLHLLCLFPFFFNFTALLSLCMTEENSHRGVWVLGGSVDELCSVHVLVGFFFEHHAFLRALRLQMLEHICGVGVWCVEYGAWLVMWKGAAICSYSCCLFVCCVPLRFNVFTGGLDSRETNRQPLSAWPCLVSPRPKCPGLLSASMPPLHMCKAQLRSCPRDLTSTTCIHTISRHHTDPRFPCRHLHRSVISLFAFLISECLLRSNLSKRSKKH